MNFLKGAFETVADLTLPDENSPEYSKFLLYKIRATLALGRSSDAENLVPKSTEHPPLKAIASLARYVSAQASGSSAKDEILEELRDLCVEVEGDDVDESDRGLVKVFAGTAFAREGEIEEALETLGAGGSSENLEACVAIHFKASGELIYQSEQYSSHRANIPIHRPP